MNIVLEGELRNIVYSNETGEFTVARLIIEAGKIETVVGNLSGLRPGEFVKLMGGWVNSPKYGRQFQVQSYMVHTPKTLVGIERYLASGILPGVGPKTASRIVEKFGEQTLQIIDKSPEQLRGIVGINVSKLSKIISAWSLRRGLSEVMVFLQSYGISPNFAERIYRIYREQTVAQLRSNPYRLAWDIRGIGFKKADLIALQMGVEPASSLRTEAAVLYQLRSFADQGHVFYPLDHLIRETSALLELPAEPIGEGVDRAIKSGRAIMQEITWDDEDGSETWRGQVLYLAKMFEAETSTALELKRILKAPSSVEPQAEFKAALTELHSKYGLELGREQEQALASTLAVRVSVITGGPGTGKTTMIRALVYHLQEQGKKLLLAAPTGRAAKRLQETTKHEAKTLHRTLEYQPHARKFARNRENPLSADWIVVDETSMVDIFLMEQLLLAIPDGTSLLLVGDADQLPSVGSGNVLRDIISSNVVPVSRLTQIYRQARGSLITLNAHSVNRGEFPKLVPFKAPVTTNEEEIAEFGSSGNDCFFIKEDSPEKMVQKICQLCREELPRRYQVDPLEDLQVITPMHKGDVGSVNLNRVLQATLNPKTPESFELTRGDRAFREFDRVMQMRNNYDKEVFNGDVGQIVNINREDAELTIRFDTTDATYTFSELDEIELAYAVTVHKAQGCEYPVVVLPITTQHYIMLERNLLYTALTRGKSLVILIGSTKAIAIAVQNNKMRRRYSLLAQRLRSSDNTSPARAFV